jgi:hypothetical protein
MESGYHTPGRAELHTDRPGLKGNGRPGGLRVLAYPTSLASAFMARNNAAICRLFAIASAV